MRLNWLVVLAVACASTLALAGQASAANITGVFAGDTVNGSAISCVAQMDGVRVCHGQEVTNPDPMGASDSRLKSFDGVPLEVYVMLPPAPTSGTDGNYPLIVQGHGWGGSAGGPNDSEFFGPTADGWAKDGYVVLQLTARGFNDSCGSSSSRTDDPTQTVTCTQNGYIRLDDERYEARDVQYATGLLVDEGVVDPNRIGVTGESYGGGLSLELATLKDRIMNSDGSLSPWKSPKGTSLHVAAAAPMIPWSDLVNSLVPNGRTNDYQITSPTADLSPIGVEKQSFVTGLFALGSESGYYGTPADQQADLPGWYSAINAGEPYDGNSLDESVVQEIAQYHSPYYLLDGAYGTAKEAPAPLLIGNGFDDDLFPVDEALRYYNLDRSLYPSDPISLFDGDFGHQPSNNKSGDEALLSSRIQQFFNYYLKSTGTQPTGVTATIETCPKTVPSGGPYSASTWAGLHPGEVFYTSKPAQTINSNSGNTTISADVDPVVSAEAGTGACTTVGATDQGSGVATYRLPKVTGNGYTLLGSTVVAADLSVSGTYAYIAARLWDVNPATNTETLVARGDYRIDSSKPDGLQVFELHPGAWHFAAGHIPKLELLGQDTPYLRKSNGTFTITVTNVTLGLPVHEVPGATGTPPPVKKPQPPPKPNPHPAPGCTTYPYSTINHRGTRASRKGIAVAGTAGERPCATAAAAAKRKERVVRVYVMIYRGVGRGRCRFLQANGRLSAPRSCARPIEFLARGTARWQLHRKLHIPRGTWVVRSDAVDGLGHHQHWSNSAREVIRVR